VQVQNSPTHKIAKLVENMDTWTYDETSVLSPDQQVMERLRLELGFSPSANQDAIHQGCPSTPKKPPEGSLLSEIARSPSPTNICNFPYFELDGSIDREKFTLAPSTESKLPKFKVKKSDLKEQQHQVNYADEQLREWDGFEGKVLLSEVTEYSVIADIGTYSRTFKIARATTERDSLVVDSGANCSMTANLSALTNIQRLKDSITIGLAVSNDDNITARRNVHSLVT
jgi:hypothetical protein